NRSQHVLLVSPVVADAGDLQIAAVAKISASAWQAGSVVAAGPANSDSLPFLPSGNAFPAFVASTRDLMSRPAMVLYSRPHAFLGDYVAVVNATCLHPNAHVPCCGLGNLAFDDFEITSRPGDLHHLHRCNC